MIVKYKVVFTAGYDDDIESLSKQIRGDVLIIDEFGNCYNPQYITIERVKSEFSNDKLCYLEDNLVLMHSITKDTIIASVEELHKWLFQKRWYPLSVEQIEKYFYPKDDWVTFYAFVDENM
jgi:hypothetical protein